MDKIHDPIRQVNFIRQSLSQDKKPLGLFLAAGCPLSIWVKGKPLIPDIARLTKSVKTELLDGANPHKIHYQSILDALDDSTGTEQNIEVILSFIRSLTEVVRGGEIFSLKKKNLEDLDRSICEIIVREVKPSLPDKQTPYHKLAAWVGSAERSIPIEIFTTNYDLLMEEALEDTRVPFFDGFVGSRTTFFDLRAIEEDYLPKRWTRFWKIHGSINWYMDEDGQVFRGNLEKGLENHLIYPSHLKYNQSRRMPYLAMLDRLKTFIKQPSSALFISGYSFSDEHINEIILQGLRANPTGIVFAFLYDKLENYPEAVKLSEKRPNLSLIAFDGGVIGTKTGGWKYDKVRDYNGKKSIQIEKDPAHPDDDSKVKVEVRLGDFGEWADFMQELIGGNQYLA